MTDGGTALVWFRRDLRLADNAALAAGLQHGRVVPVFILDPEADGEWATGAAGRWWLHQSLEALSGAIAARGGRLILRHGDTRRELLRLAEECGAGLVCWSRRYDPAARRDDERVADALRGAGIDCRVFKGSLLAEPDRVQTQAGDPYRVFTPFWRAVSVALEPGDPRPAPETLPAVADTVDSVPLSDLALLPTIPWYRGFGERWAPGEDGAHERLEDFAAAGARAYGTERNRADRAGSSRLSPHLAWGELSPRQIWTAVREGRAGTGGEAFLRELGWREFSYHLLWHFPDTPLEPLNRRFAAFEWRDSEADLSRWQAGRTGVPLVDAGMRELWHTGWLHNRCRMIVASFLTKNLLIPWQYGARWFWDTLVDADLANNTQGWQWTAGCGADAAPYFRIFNPVRQAAGADPSGDYVRRWVPELARLPDRYLHSPWEASGAVLAAAGVALGDDYPEPMADLLATRRRALDRFEQLKVRAPSNP